MKVLIIYIPAIHRGYVDFLKKYPDSRIFLLDKSLLPEEPRMERDIRALSCSEVKKILEAIGFSNISILSKDNLFLLDKAKEIIMLEEDVSYKFKETYLKEKKKVKMVSFFLRWDKHASEKKNVVIPNRKISREDFDKKIIKKAYKEAKKSPDWWRQIGAIIIKDKKILLKGFNRPLESLQTHNIFGDPRSNFDYGVSFELSKFIHAEASIIAKAAKEGIPLEGSSIYVTTFPCPVCAKLIAISGIKKVYYNKGYSLLDAKDILDAFKIEAIEVEEE